MHRRITLLLLLGCAVSAFAQESPQAADTTAANKALVQRYITEVLSANRLDKLGEMVAADFVDSTPGAEAATGLAVVQNAQERIRSVFPTVDYTVDDLIADGDRVVARYRVVASTGANPPKTVRITGITIFRVSGGKLAEEWIINDQIEMYRQLGFKLQPPAN